jgi:hypothetical protein
MKKISLTILFAAALAFAGSLALSSCGSKSHDETHTEEDAMEEVHEDEAMHEHEGEAHDSTAHEHTDEALAYACPMHPEEKGNEGDTCSKCKMALVKIKTEEVEQ